MGMDIDFEHLLDYLLVFDDFDGVWFLSLDGVWFMFESFCVCVVAMFLSWYMINAEWQLAATGERMTVNYCLTTQMVIDCRRGYFR